MIPAIVLSQGLAGEPASAGTRGGYVRWDIPLHAIGTIDIRQPSTESRLGPVDAVRALVHEGRIVEARQLAVATEATLPDNLRAILTGAPAQGARSDNRGFDPRTFRAALGEAARYAGEWVAVCDGVIVDHDTNRAAMRARLTDPATATLLFVPKRP